ncbi:Acetyltransferase, GNAT family [Chryseobacterium ureilyticum]|uniref:Acetyltransferase, GNAT family n=1 Tax=Chryseobacterium ureilyticum TaxID=373668 RepID=A0A1N7LZQ0_9FLAO|nr:GNAT family N-acetyltransferase [Chryseobacterium ureilyticum]SIS79320.1 Acetyltransferase, GNAT family [Chryseobacterium ureilyticum]
MSSNILDNQSVNIRPGNLQDLPEMLILFKETIISICKKDYNTDQLEAWKSGAYNLERWLKVMKEQIVLVAEMDHQIVGFCTLDQGHYIDLLFVHKDHQHLGIASLLYNLIEKEAIKQNNLSLTADVSKTAKPFFKRMGFHVISEQTVHVKGVDLINYKMQKNLLT